MLSKKLLAGLTPLLAVAAFAVIPAVAQALPKWEHCEVNASGTGEFTEHQCATLSNPPNTGGWKWQVIPTTTNTSQTKEQVKTHGVLTLTASNGLAIECQVQDKGVIWNEANGVPPLRWTRLTIR
jgi:hypothetical protein